MDLFFKKLIESCKADFFDLKPHLLETLKQGGVEASFADLDFQEEGIYFTFPDKSRVKVLFYQDKIQESAFRTQGDPLVHFRGCKEALELSSRLNACKAIIKYDNKLFLGVYSHKTQIRFFNDKPLPLCPLCKSILKGASLAEFLKM